MSCSENPADCDLAAFSQKSNLQQIADSRKNRSNVKQRYSSLYSIAAKTRKYITRTESEKIAGARRYEARLTAIGLVPARRGP